MKPSLDRKTPRQKLIYLAVAAALSVAEAQANPVNPVVVNGSAGFAQAGSTLSITNSPGAIINWQGFSIAASETTRFIQQSAASSVLNRVVGPDPSLLMGTLSSNGRVFLVNQSGIFVGAGARIDVAGLVATTLNLSNTDFLAGRNNFQPVPSAGTIINNGLITTPTGGSVYLVAPNVTNNGIINTPQGEVILAAGNSVQLVDSSTPGVRVQFTATDNKAENLGDIIAQSGKVGVVGAVIRNKGNINADQVVRGENGQIFFRARKDITLDAGSRISASGDSGGDITVQAEQGTLLASGTVAATGADGKGGDIRLLGANVGLIDRAAVNVSGSIGGGQVLVGGDYRGKNAEVQNSTAIYIGPEVLVSANATASGDGGKVIAWSESATRIYGGIQARGATGSGGFVETSSKGFLEVGAGPDLGSSSGRGGTWLLDPFNIEVVAGSGNINIGTGPAFAPTGSNSQIGVALINAQLNGNVSVTLDTTGGGADAGNILVTAGISRTSGGTPAALSLLANNDISVVGGIDNTSGQAMNVTMTANQASSGTTGAISISGDITTQNGTITASGKTIDLTAKLTSGTASTTLTATTGGITSNSAADITAGTLQIASVGGVDLMGGSHVGNLVANVSGSGNAFQFANKISFNVPTSAGPGRTINTNNGNIKLQAKSGGTINFFTGANEGIAAGTGNITVIADDIVINSPTGTTISGGNISIEPDSLTRNVEITASPTTGKLFLTPTNLGRVAASGQFSVGGTDPSYSGNLIVSSPLVSADINAPTFKLVGSDVSLNANIGGLGTEFTHSLELRATNNANVTVGNIYLSDGNSLKLYADTDSSGAGSVNIGGDTLIVGSSAGNTGSMDVKGQNVNIVLSGGGGNNTLVKVWGSGTQTFTANNQIQVANNLSGGSNSVTVQADTGLQTFDTSLATGLGDLLVSGGSTVTGSSASIQSNGSQSINLKGVLTVQGGSTAGSTAQITALTGQTIVAKELAVNAQGGNSVMISNNTSGAQVITINGANSSNGIDVTSTGGAGSTAMITNLAAGGTQNISVNNAQHINVIGSAGNAQIHANGTQTIAITGASSTNAINVGGSAAAGLSQIDSNASQVISAGSSVQAGAINIVGGNAGGSSNTARIMTVTGGTFQTVTTSGNLTLVGGTGVITGNSTACSTAGACALLANSGSGPQSITAKNISLTGGASGSFNVAQIQASNGGAQSVTVSGNIAITGGAGAAGNNFATIQQFSGGAQAVTVNGGGAITLIGGSSSDTAGPNGSFAGINTQGTAQTINFTSGGSLNLTGGSVGNRNTAAISADTASAVQTILGAPSVSLVGGGSGGDTLAGTIPSNGALISARLGTQSFTLGSTTLAAGGGGNENFASIEAPTQTINITGNLAVSGGAGSGTFNGARIGGTTGAGNLTLTTSGSITLNGGSAANSGASIGSNPSGNSTTNITISAGGDITLNPGAGAGARIGSPSGNISAGNISVASTGGNIVFNGSGAFGTGIRTAGNVSLQANAAGKFIFEDTAAAIQALALSTSSNAGAVLNGANAISSFQANNFVSGSISLNANTSPTLTIAGITQSGSGGVVVNNTGNITVSGNVTSGGGAAFQTLGAGVGFLSVNAPISAGGNVTLTATPAGSDVLVSSGITAGTGGASTLTISATNNAAFSTGGSVTAGGANALKVALFADSDNSGAGGINFGAPTLINSNGGNISLSGGATGTAMLNTSGTLNSNNNPVTLSGGNMNLAGTINAGTGVVTLFNNSGGNVSLGLGAFGFGLSNTELNTFTASSLVLNGSPVVLDGAVNVGGVGGFTLNATSLLANFSLGVSGGSLSINCANDVTLTASTAPVVLSGTNVSLGAGNVFVNGGASAGASAMIQATGGNVAVVTPSTGKLGFTAGTGAGATATLLASNSVTINAGVCANCNGAITAGGTISIVESTPVVAAAATQVVQQQQQGIVAGITSSTINAATNGNTSNANTGSSIGTDSVSTGGTAGTAGSGGAGTTSGGTSGGSGVASSGGTLVVMTGSVGGVAVSVTEAGGTIGGSSGQFGSSGGAGAAGTGGGSGTGGGTQLGSSSAGSGSGGATGGGSTGGGSDSSGSGGGSQAGGSGNSSGSGGTGRSASGGSGDGKGGKDAKGSGQDKTKKAEDKPKPKKNSC